MLNRTEVIGHLGRDPEMSYTPSGRALCKFSVAVSRRWKNDKGEQQEHTDWFNVTVWGQLAEVCNTYLHKGSKVYCAGRMESRKYTDKDNVERMAWDLVLADMEMLDTKPKGAGASEESATADDIPF